MNSPEKTLSKELLLLDPKDNIAVLKRSVKVGNLLSVPCGNFSMSTSLDMGHKVAVRRIAKGEDVLKYGAPIGFAAVDIALGEHVHLHNITSRYTIIDDMEAPKNDV